MEESGRTIEESRPSDSSTAVILLMISRINYTCTVCTTRYCSHKKSYILYIRHQVEQLMLQERDSTRSLTETGFNYSTIPVIPYTIYGSTDAEQILEEGHQV